MIQRTIKNRIRYSKYKLLLMLIGVLSAHSWTQAQSSPPTNEVTIDIDTTASWEKIKKEKKFQIMININHGEKKNFQEN